MHGAQKALANNPNVFLLKLENQLISEFSLILLQEEYWALKSKLNATTFGDQNTSFFHVSTLVRHHRNKIRCVKDDSRNWLIGEDEIKEHIMAGFRKLYTIEQTVSFMTSDVSNFSYCFLGEEDREKIDGVVTNEEIKLGLWALKPFKAPGLDGLHVGFYQHFWIKVKNFVCMEIRQIFS